MANIRDILAASKTIAVVGCSPDPGRDSHMVAAFMQRQGYEIIPVRPGGGEILGVGVVGRLAEIGRPVDIVDVFRRSEDALGVVEETVRLDPLPKAVWLQFGVINEQARELCERAGVACFMDQCLKIDWQNARL